jgi:phosphatidate phosphatase APP1
MVTWIVTLKAPSGDIVGSGEVEAAVGGLAVFEVTIDATSRSQQTETGVVQIVMNDQVIGTTEVQNGRIILRAEVEQTEFGRNPATGETINIRAKNYGRFIVSTVFDFATKATRAVEAHTVGQADWTTLEVPGLTSQ